MDPSLDQATGEPHQELGRVDGSLCFFLVKELKIFSEQFELEVCALLSGELLVGLGSFGVSRLVSSFRSDLRSIAWIRFRSHAHSQMDSSFKLSHHFNHGETERNASSPSGRKVKVCQGYPQENCIRMGYGSRWLMVRYLTSG